MLNNTYFRWFKDPLNMNEGYTDVMIQCDGSIFDTSITTNDFIDYEKPRYQACELVKGEFCSNSEPNTINFIYECLPDDELLPTNAIHMVGYSKTSDRKYIINWSDTYDDYIFRFENFTCKCHDLDEYYEEYEELDEATIGRLMLLCENIENLLLGSYVDEYCSNSINILQKCAEDNHYNWYFVKRRDIENYEECIRVESEKWHSMTNYDIAIFTHPDEWDTDDLKEWEELVKLHPHISINKTLSDCVIEYPDGSFYIERAYQVHFNEQSEELSSNNNDEEADSILASNEYLRKILKKINRRIKDGSTFIFRDVFVADFICTYLSDYIVVFDNGKPDEFWCQLKYAYEQSLKLVNTIEEGHVPSKNMSMIIRAKAWMVNTKVFSENEYEWCELDDDYIAVFYNKNVYDCFRNSFRIGPDTLNKILIKNDNLWLIPVIDIKW